MSSSGLSVQESSGHTRPSCSNSHQNDQGDVQGNKREKSYSMKVVKHGNRLPERLWSHSKFAWTWPWATCFYWTCFEHVVALAVHGGLFQPAWIYDLRHSSQWTWATEKNAEISEPSIQNNRCESLQSATYSSYTLLHSYQDLQTARTYSWNCNITLIEIGQLNFMCRP